MGVSQAILSLFLDSFLGICFGLMLEAFGLTQHSCPWMWKGSVAAGHPSHNKKSRPEQDSQGI